MEIFKTILPALITIICNILFYWTIKSGIDKSIEKHKISYAGVFKEKIEIYRRLLSMIFDLEKDLYCRVYSMSREDFEKISVKFNDFIAFYSINQPYLSLSLIEKIKNIRKEYSQCFDDIWIGQSKNYTEEGERLKMELRNKLRTNYFDPMQEEIISEMRNDLQIN